MGRAIAVANRTPSRRHVRKISCVEEPYQRCYRDMVREARERLYPPTLEEASVRLLRVVLFPAEGLPTRPINGSRGMLCGRARAGEDLAVDDGQFLVAG